ncbi:hypothetical protein EDC65_0055 [Stella humosa]|uniref:Uncharacterized protein n=1 Tax=Stella humosa TaxID=94 RepID=A0A3N1MC07_9PROT|nr:hypothetical protein [Stella humosa]ROQ03372.1 hypothetical protein EDC65_0055 [Stella humosa]BBK29660.1 hypothetical protein STHU_02940 [Stella humosa]
MAKRTAAAGRANQFRAGAKFDEMTLMRLVYCFCQGLGVQLAARSTGLTAKTVRGVYIALRKRLLKPAFNRWHGTNRAVIRTPMPEFEPLLRAVYFDRLGRCAGNETCARNYRLGNRKRRECRSCPLVDALPPEGRAEAYVVIDAVHAFYEAIGIRGEKDIGPIMLFRERLIHRTVVGTVQNHSRKRENGLFDPNEREFLSGGTLLDLLLRDLAEDPL